MNRIFAILGEALITRRMVRRGLEFRVVPMRTLRNIRSVSLRVAPHWAMCVILGAYFSIQLISPVTISG